MRASDFGEKVSDSIIEPLEQRRLMSAGFDPLTNNLVVVGTTGDDNIRISLNNLDPTILYVTVNGKVRKFAASKLVSTGSKISKIVVNGLDGNDKIVVNDDPGLNFSARLYGNAGNDSIIGGIGADKITGGSGNDTLNGGLGNDSLFGKSGDDSLLGANGDDALDGGIGSDTVFGNNGSDHCHGGNGDDLIYGGSEQDLIDGGPGVDSVYGNGGSDLFRTRDDSASERKDFSSEDGLL